MNTVTHGTLTDCQLFDRSTSVHHVGMTGRIAGIVEIWRNRIRDRRAFAYLDYRELRDMGLSQWEVDREVTKPFWRG